MMARRFPLVVPKVVSWVIIAQRGGAKIFSCIGKGKSIKLIREIDHPAAHLKNSQLDSDKPGSSYSSAGTLRHALTHEQTAQEHGAELFAQKLAAVLEEARNQELYDQLVLVAEPGFLGRLRAALSKQTSGKVVASLSKELLKVSERDLEGYLEEVSL